MATTKTRHSASDTLAAADRVLIAPEWGTLAARVEEILRAVADGDSSEQAGRTLLRLGMNFAGRDAEIVGYGADEAEAALEQVLTGMSDLESGDPSTAATPVRETLAEMRSVNLEDSLTGLLAERIEAELDDASPGVSFLKLFKRHLRSGVYWRMIGERYCKFGNDFARGLEYLRHYGFCQVSTNPVLAAKAFDEDDSLVEELRRQIDGRGDWKRDPSSHTDEIAMAATLIAVLPNLATFRPLALHAELRDFMVSFQLNPNIADSAEASIEDARNAYGIVSGFFEEYDAMLGVDDGHGSVGANIVFKVAGSHPAAREITRTLNAQGIGTNNTVVYTVAQEVQLVLDAFEGKAEAIAKGRPVVRTYETNMGGRLVSHLREVEAERLFAAAAAEVGEAKASEILDHLASSLGVDDATLESVASAPVAEKAGAICAYAFLKSLDHPMVLRAAQAVGRSPQEIRQLEEDLKRAGTLVARRVYWLFYSPDNRPRWTGYLRKRYGLSEEQARWVLESMDVLPASKRIPEDTYHTLGSSNMCNTEFPNHARAVQLMSEQEGFSLEAFREAVLDSYGPEVVQRLRRLPDFCRGYDLTPSLRSFLIGDVGIDVGSWQTSGLEPVQWPAFGPVQKTVAEFRAAYDTFAARCLSIAEEAAAG